MISFNDHKRELNNRDDDKESSPSETVWKSWKSLVNVDPKEFAELLTAEEKEPDFDQVHTYALRESVRMLSEMMKTGTTHKEAADNWSRLQWKWCRTQISNITRLRKIRKRLTGNPFEKEGKKTKWYKNLLLWGNDPKKPLKIV
jgi:hypothetical protein